MRIWLWLLTLAVHPGAGGVEDANSFGFFEEEAVVFLCLKNWPSRAHGIRPHGHGKDQEAQDDAVKYRNSLN